MAARLFLAVPPLLGVALAGCAAPPGEVAPSQVPDIHLLIRTSMGEIRVVLFHDLAPITAGNFLNLTRQGFYNGTRFHRVIDGFMIQGGDPLTKDPAQRDRWGTGGPGYTIPDEFPCNDGTTSRELPARCEAHGGLKLKHDREGLLSMANTGRPQSGGSQYFITLAPTPHLDGRHPIFGSVEGGIEVVRAIGKVATDEDDRPLEDVVVQSVEVVGGSAPEP